jgi:hypothetical protein
LRKTGKRLIEAAVYRRLRQGRVIPACGQADKMKGSPFPLKPMRLHAPWSYPHALAERSHRGRFGRVPRARLAATLAIALFAASVCAFEGFTLDADGKHASYRSASGARRELPRGTDQSGFSQVAISPDRNYIGWLALFPTCCTSYPVPLALVVMNRRGEVRKFDGAQATFAWCFFGKAAVATRREPLHGPPLETYELWEIKTGRRLAAHATGAEGDAAPLPAWARCAASR